MIKIEPIGDVRYPYPRGLTPEQMFTLPHTQVEQERRYPAPIKEPVRVPIQPAITPPPVIIPEKKKSGLGLFLLLGGVVALVAAYLPEEKPGSVGALPKKRRGRRLYYMWLSEGARWSEAKSIPQKRAFEYTKKAAEAGGDLYYLWAHTADQARHLLETDPESRVVAKYRYGPRTPEQLPLFSGRKHVRYKRGDLDSVVAAAKRYHARFEYDDPMYIFATAGGYTLQQRPPIGTQSYLTVHPDGRVEEVDPLEEEMKAGRGPQQLPLFSGRTANCGLWQEKYAPGVGKGRLVWRCLQYAPACEPQPDGVTACVTDPVAEKAKKLRVCVKKKLVSSAFYGKPVHRCARYEAVCTGRACLPEPMPTPEPEPEPEISAEAIKSLAQYYADEYNKGLKAETPAFITEIMERGGIRPYRARTRAGKVDEEYMESVPLFLRRKRGLPPDEMASEMDFESDTDLYREIIKVYGTQPLKPTKGMGKKKPVGPVTKTWRDFREDARLELIEQARAGFGFGQDQPEMFKLKRELVLTPEDIATSDDPVDICLERGGWKLRRVRELQASIAEKMVPDLFTGKKGKLTGGEKMLQDNIDDCLKRIAKGRRTGKPKQMTLFGAGCRDEAGLFVPVPQCTGRGKLPEEEAWAMTSDEFVEEVRAGRDFPQLGVKRVTTPLKRLRAAKDWKALDSEARGYHEGQTVIAYAEGNPVPREVLAEYPYLLKAEKPEERPEEPFMDRHPFTKKQTEAYNRYTHYPIDFNKEFDQQATAQEGQARAKLAEYEVEQTPATVDKALYWYRKQLYEYYLTRFKAQSYAPPPMVVGPAKYPTHRLAKAEAWERKAREKVEKAESRLQTAINTAVKGRLRTGERTFEEMALETPRRIFGQKFHKMVVDKEKGVKTRYAEDLRRGLFKDTLRKRGRNLHKKLIESAVEAGKPIPENVIKDYKDLVPKANIIAPVAPVGFLEGAPAYVWKSTYEEFMARPRTKDDPSLPSELNWILQKTKLNPEGMLRVFRGRLPGHMRKRLNDWLWDRHRHPERWLEDKRIKISFKDMRYGIRHPFYHISVKFYKDGTVQVIEDRQSYHGESVEAAIKEGKKVPVRVLKQYAPYIPEAKVALG